MQVKVLFFGQLKELVGTGEEQVELPAGAAVADLLARYRLRVPHWADMQPSLAVAVNQEYAEPDAPLRADDEVAFLPPVSGGAPEAGTPDRIELTRQPIPTAEIAAALKAPADGAVVVFEGIVRNHAAGRETLHLDYEAYEPMAVAALRELAAELRARFALDGLALVHRLGRLEIGETSVLVVVTAAHRAAAFDACRAAIEQIKRAVPIWKKETSADGSAWVEGTPLPATASRGSEARAPESGASVAARPVVGGARREP